MWSDWYFCPILTKFGVSTDFNPLALELDIQRVAHHLCKMWIFYEPKQRYEIHDIL